MVVCTEPAQHSWLQNTTKPALMIQLCSVDERHSGSACRVWSLCWESRRPGLGPSEGLFTCVSGGRCWLLAWASWLPHQVLCAHTQCSTGLPQSECPGKRRAGGSCPCSRMPLWRLHSITCTLSHNLGSHSLDLSPEESRDPTCQQKKFATW